MENFDLRAEWALSADQPSSPTSVEEETQPVLKDRFVSKPSASAMDVASSSERSDNKTCLNRLFRCFNYVIAVTSMLLLVAQIVSVINLPFDAVELVMKIFVSSFCVLIVMVELALLKTVRDSPILWKWIPRGYFYAFIGLVSVEENNVKESLSSSTIRFNDLPTFFIEVISWIMVTLGIFRIILGACCCQKYEKTRKDEENNLTEMAIRHDLMFVSAESDPAPHWAHNDHDFS